MADKKGLVCPTCGAEEDFKTGQLKRETGKLTRPHTCNTCGAEFYTVQVVIGLIKDKPK